MDTVSMVRDYKGSFDMDWLMCVGICSKKAGREPIGVTAIPWVASVGESNFWAPGGAPADDPCAKVRPWFKIFAAITQMNDWHSEKLAEVGLLTDDCKAYVEWVKACRLRATRNSPTRSWRSWVTENSLRCQIPPSWACLSTTSRRRQHIFLPALAGLFFSRLRVMEVDTER